MNQSFYVSYVNDIIFIFHIMNVNDREENNASNYSGKFIILQISINLPLCVYTVIN